MVNRVAQEKIAVTIKDVIDNQLCTGCGVCISEDSSATSQMIWNEDGFLIPRITEESSITSMLKVCPFNLKRQSLINEDMLAKEVFKGIGHSDDDIGFYKELYVGYSKQYRESSSSGGIATYIFEKLLTDGYVDNVFIVKEFQGRYAYQVFNDANKIREISRTRYYPVTLEDLFKNINNISGRIAVSGVSCFIKAIRLKQHHYPELRTKIPFLVGIICGGLKSRYYTDYLSQSAGCHDEYTNAEYRVKKKNSFALDYQFSCLSKKNKIIHVVDMQAMGDMWGTGLFKSNACDFCDDVTTELADISLGDAWIEPYNLDGNGNNVVICRSELAKEIIANGIRKEELTLDLLPLSLMKLSQQGSFNHRHKGLSYRIKKANANNIQTPIKRHRFLKKQSFILNLIQERRLRTRHKSIEIWKKTKNSNDFDNGMYKYLKSLRRITTLNRRFNRVLSFLKRKIVGSK
ncbi:Coenzyme F420 hydrogenase/dehydrogenase, beta subunit C-terminal domain [Citrobacter amalonaticus]|uniref:Coenzyme F420 hydrogenase/dehydrogenase, beta subunit C-terminal domain n=1 Tax=Citrobacter amalonaticus TaxID=35703 RepID=UPI0031F2D80D